MEPDGFPSLTITDLLGDKVNRIHITKRFFLLPLQVGSRYHIAIDSMFKSFCWKRD